MYVGPLNFNVKELELCDYFCSTSPRGFQSSCWLLLDTFKGTDEVTCLWLMSVIVEIIALLYNDIAFSKLIQFPELAALTGLAIWSKLAYPGYSVICTNMSANILYYISKCNYMPDFSVHLRSLVWQMIMSCVVWFTEWLPLTSCFCFFSISREAEEGHPKRKDELWCNVEPVTSHATLQWGNLIGARYRLCKKPVQLQNINPPF